MKKVAAAAGRILLLLFIYLASQFVVTMVVMLAHIVPLVFSMITRGEGIDIVWVTEETIRSISGFLPLILILSVIIAVLFYLLVYRNRKTDIKEFCRFRALSPLMILAIILFGLSLNGLLDSLLTLASRIQAFNKLFPITPTFPPSCSAEVLCSASLQPGSSYRSSKNCCSAVSFSANCGKSQTRGQHSSFRH